MGEKINWGILGPGAIAKKFARAFPFVHDARLIAVGSRNSKRAKKFADQFRIPKYYGSYQELAADPQIDVIYIATPHGRHFEDIKLCLENGKAVLCEKSFTLNAAQAKEAIELAASKKLFLMEAMWTRFLPVMKELRQMVRKGVIGELRMLVADLGFNFPFDAQSRLFNPILGGGTLLDVGVYPVSLSQWLLGKPQQIVSQVVLGSTGVDEQAGMVFKYHDGILAQLFTSIRSVMPSQAILMGTKGLLTILPPLFCPNGIVLESAKGKEKHFPAKMEGNGYNYEIAEVNRCLQEGKLQSEIMPWKDTIEVMEIMDALRAQWGLVYPQEEK